MLAQGVGSEQLTEIISTFNDLLTARVIELTVAEMGARQDPPRRALLLDGAGQRRGAPGADPLHPTSDNGLIFETPDGWTPDQARQQLLPFARPAVNEGPRRLRLPAVARAG